LQLIPGKDGLGLKLRNSWMLRPNLSSRLRPCGESSGAGKAAWFMRAVFCRPA